MDENRMLSRVRELWYAGLVGQAAYRMLIKNAVYASSAVMVLWWPLERAEATGVDCELAVDARFTESAPRDIFSIHNQSAGQWSIVSIRLDLSASVGQLIFDTEDGGKGVEVFQPFNVAQGTAIMSKAEVPKDGDSALHVQFERFGAGESFSFSIDVDDQLIDSALGQIRVSGSEIAGSVLQAVLVNQQEEERTQLLRFTDESITVVERSGC